MEVRGQLVEIRAFPSHNVGSQGLKSWYQPWQQAPWCTELSQQSDFFFGVIHKANAHLSINRSGEFFFLQPSGSSCASWVYGTGVRSLEHLEEIK